MTTDRLAVIQAVQQVGDEELLRQLAEVALAKRMAVAVERLVGATQGKHALERTPCRTGYCDRPRHTCLGTRDLRIPTLGQGTYFPRLLESRRVSARALTAVIQEAGVGGMSPRKVDCKPAQADHPNHLSQPVSPAPGVHRGGNEPPQCPAQLTLYRSVATQVH